MRYPFLWILVVMTSKSEDKITTSSWYVLTLKSFNNILEEDFSYNYNISFQKSGKDSAVELCEFATTFLLFYDSYCFAKASQTYRTLRYLYVHTIYKKITENLYNIANFNYSTKQNEYLLALTWVYEVIDIPVRVCLIGQFHIPSLMSILLSSDLYEILMFVEVLSPIDETALEYLRMLFPSRMIGVLTGHVTQTLHAFLTQDLGLGVGHLTCDIIHIFDDSSLAADGQNKDVISPNPLLLSDVVNVLDNVWDSTTTNLATSDTSNSVSVSDTSGPLVVLYRSAITSIFEQNIGINVSFNPNVASVSWVMGTTVLAVTDVLVMTDSEGFLPRFFTTDQLGKHANIGAITIGYWRPATMVAASKKTNFRMTILITYTNRVFEDTAYSLSIALRRVIKLPAYLAKFQSALGLPRDTTLQLKVSVCGDLNMHVYRTVLQNSDFDPLQIALGPHELTTLLKNYVAFQYEQSWSTYFKAPFVDSYSKVLVGATGVWLFSEQSIPVLLSLGVRADRMHLIPVYSFVQESQKISSTIYTEEKAEKEEIYDVIFFGSCSPRRTEIIYEFDRQRQQHALIDKLLVAQIVCGGWAELWFGNKRDEYIRQAKVVLNIHLEETSALEVHRLNLLLAMGKPVVSERSMDADVDTQYEQALVFVNNKTELFDTTLELVKSPGQRRALSVAARRKSDDINNNLEPLGNALAEALQIAALSYVAS